MRGKLNFSWRFRDGRWQLTPSSISVVPLGDYWMIHVGGQPVNARYTSEQGAKLDAWEFAKSRRMALFGTRRIGLVES
jgi:hypothetical protein